VGCIRTGVVTERSPQWAVLCGAPRARRDLECGPVPGLPLGSRSHCGQRAAEAGRAADRLSPGQRGPASHRARALGRVSRGRRRGTDGPGASTIRSLPTRGPGPDDSDLATAGAAGRALRAVGARGGWTHTAVRSVTQPGIASGESDHPRAACGPPTAISAHGVKASSAFCSCTANFDLVHLFFSSGDRISAPFEPVSAYLA
jgi:hypothetical protein